MLYPDFKELAQLGLKASHLRLGTARQSMAVGPGAFISPFRGRGLEFHEVREYHFGDDIRTIDWRVTARVGKPHVKVFTEERERTVLLCVDANAAMRFGTRGTFKSVQAARAAALLGWHASASNDRVGCLVFGDVREGMQFFSPTHSRRALWQTMKLLSQTVQDTRKVPVPLEAPLQHLDRVAPTGSLLFLISDFQVVTEALERQLGILHRTSDIVLIAVNDPADREIPAMETVIFADNTGHKFVFDTESPAGRQAYARQWRENRKRLENIARRWSVGVIDLHTDKDVSTDLLLGLRRLNIGRAKR